ncbi:MAG: hypothetical protein J1E02_06730 [Coprobacter sp.]|nr:hypothetical protein [Coprobacter sp.]
MNIKIKSAGVYCLIGDDYSRVYATLKKQFGEGEEQLFTERTPGHEYLQWELPGDGWKPLSESDPLMSQEVRRELRRRQEAVSLRFGNNQEMAERVLSVPDDSFIYYKPDDSGRLLIRLTAWGYRYPERINSQGMVGRPCPQTEVEHVSLHIVYNGKSVPGQAFHINGFSRIADTEGRYDIGDLPVGYQFDIDIDDHHQHITVLPGQGQITVDITRYTLVEIEVYLDEQPCAAAAVGLQYAGLQRDLTTGGSGKVTTQLPLDPENGLCTVTVEGETRQQPLFGEMNRFVFRLVSPEPEPLPEPLPEPELPDEKPEEQPEEKTDEQPVVEEQLPDEKPEEQPGNHSEEEEQTEEEPEETAEEEPEEEPRPEPPAISSAQLWLLLLGTALLTGATYWFCYKLLFA